MENQTNKSQLLNAGNSVPHLEISNDKEDWREYVAKRDKVFEWIYNSELRSAERMLQNNKAWLARQKRKNLKN